MEEGLNFVSIQFLMKIIVIVGKRNQKKTRLMLELLDKETIGEVKRLVNNLKCPEATFP